ncbi:protein EXORDIUM-like [Panicum miliaceum]|uniref:Protein EXORDIUM-like n=1 Tax=Panicum miliaceum TaxID=4540 RepID=A0A3L6RWG4_PANMI|nr:protein EXORDIUM-like [Panicum miliaceum]
MASRSLISTRALQMAAALIVLSQARPSLCQQRRELELVEIPTGDQLTYHGGAVLSGDIPVSIVWYGSFSPEKKAIVVDFIESLTSKPASATPSVAQWWGTIRKVYLSNATASGGGGGGDTRVLLASQAADEQYSLGKSLTLGQVSQLAAGAAPGKGALVLVLTGADVVVEGFGSVRCGLHGADAGAGYAYAWAGDAERQCPGQCAWPFARPSYGPQDKPLAAPNGDVGVDGMMVTLASMVAGAVTNPFRDAYYQGEKDAALEACTACAGVYGSGSYPGYAGDVLVDQATGGSYNAVGAGGHKYLLPAVYDTAKPGCSTLV